MARSVDITLAKLGDTHHTLKYKRHKIELTEQYILTTCDYARINGCNQHLCLKTSSTMVTLIMHPFFNSASKCKISNSIRSCVLHVSKSLEAELGDIIHCC